MVARDFPGLPLFRWPHGQAARLWCFGRWDTDGPMPIPSLLRQDLSRRAHIGIPAGTGIAAAAVVGATAGWRFSFAAGWIATATVYLIWVWASIAKVSATAIEVIVQQRHPARRPADLIILIPGAPRLAGCPPLPRRAAA